MAHGVIAYFVIIFYTHEKQTSHYATRDNLLYVVKLMLLAVNLQKSFLLQRAHWLYYNTCVQPCVLRRASTVVDVSAQTGAPAATASAVPDARPVLSAVIIFQFNNCVLFHFVNFCIDIVRPQEGCRTFWEQLKRRPNGNKVYLLTYFLITVNGVATEWDAKPFFLILLHILS